MHADITNDTEVEKEDESYPLLVPQELSAYARYNEDYYLSLPNTMMSLMKLSDLKIALSRALKEIHDTTIVVKLRMQGHDPATEINRNPSANMFHMSRSPL